MCSTAKVSVPVGMCGPCCSVAPVGNSAIARGAIALTSDPRHLMQESGARYAHWVKNSFQFS